MSALVHESLQKARRLLQEEAAKMISSGNMAMDKNGGEEGTERRCGAR